MGFSISWLAIEGFTKEAMLERLSLRDTGEIDPAGESPFSAVVIPTGWAILFSNDVGYPKAQLLSALSKSCRVLACQVEEHCMASAACLYDDGVETWSIEHVSDRGILDLSVSGTPPNEFHAIRDRLFQQQKEEDAENKGGVLRTDFIFDIPVETAAAICGYRHDRWKFDWGEPVFTRADEIPG